MKNTQKGVQANFLLAKLVLALGACVSLVSFLFPQLPIQVAGPLLICSSALCLLGLFVAGPLSKRWCIGVFVVAALILPFSFFGGGSFPLVTIVVALFFLGCSGSRSSPEPEQQPSTSG